MINNTPESKLDQTVKDTLSNYEAAYDADDWTKMESMLEAAPKSSTFNWSAVIGLAAIIVLIGGGYFLYTVFSSSKENDKSENPASENVINSTQSTVTNTPPVTPAGVNSSAVSKEVKREIASPDKIIPSKEPLNKTIAEDRTFIREDQTKKDKTNLNKTEEESDLHEGQKVMGMGNEPVFGDMLDSSKGIIGETREREETKKAAKAKKDLPVGWDNFMLKNVNPDSLKKHREKRDSSKVK